MSNHKNHIEQIYVESCYFACLNNRILIMHNKFIANFFVSNSSAIWIFFVSLCGGWLTQDSRTVHSVTVNLLGLIGGRYSIMVYLGCMGYGDYCLTQSLFIITSWVG